MTKIKDIQAKTAQKWLNRPGFSWKNVKKKVFIDGHKREDVVNDSQKFLQIMCQGSSLTIED